MLGMILIAVILQNIRRNYADGNNHTTERRMGPKTPESHSSLFIFPRQCALLSSASCLNSDSFPRLNLDRHTGSYFDKKGRRQKHWSWHDFSHHVHAPPFQPICMKLNIYIRIKVVAQDHISLSFMNQQNCIHFNVGTRLKLKDPATLHLLKPAESQLGRLLHSKSIQINSLLAKMKKVLRDLQGTPLNKIQTLPLVMALLRKLLKWRRRKILA